MVCIILGLGEKALGKIDQEIYLDEIHYKYNFIILPVENNEIILFFKYVVLHAFRGERICLKSLKGT